MISARDSSNLYLSDHLRTKQRMRALSATTHLISDVQIEQIAAWVVFGVILTAVGIVWVMG